MEAEDTFDGFCPTDDFDEQLAAADGIDPLVLLRRRLGKAEAHRRRRARRRTRSRSGACVDVHVDLRTLADLRNAAEQWSRKQRRAIASRDGGCVFPGCGRPPRHCDIHHLHHLHHRSNGGPTRTANAAMLCRFHHRLLHHHGWRLVVEGGHRVAIDAHGTRWTGRPTAVTSARGDPP